METILQRIEKIALNEGIKITVFEKKIGASKGVLSRAINNGTDIQAKWLQSIVENYPRYSEAWLITGRGSMLREDVPPVSVQPAQSSDLSGKAEMYYSMYKEEKAENKALSEEIGALKLTVRQLEEKVLGLQAWKDANDAPFLQPKEITTEKPASFSPKPLPRKDSPAGYAPVHSME